MDELVETLGVVVLAIGAVLVVAVLTACPLMLLWNWLMPHIFNLPVIDFWEALGMAFMCSILFKNSSGSKK